MNNNQMQLPDVEKVCSRVHDAWMKTKQSQGVTSRLSEKNEELMVPYDQLSEEAKDLDRGTVNAVYEAINEEMKEGQEGEHTAQQQHEHANTQQ